MARRSRAADVAFTYNLIKKNPSINGGGLAIKSVTTSGNTVTLKLRRHRSTRTSSRSRRTVYIVPQHIWQNAGDPSTYAEREPRSVPARTRVQSVGASRPRPDRQPKYWGGPFGGNGPGGQDGAVPGAEQQHVGAVGAAETDQVDWAGNFIAGVKKAVAGKPLVFWSPPLNTNSLEPNLQRVADQPAGSPSGDQPRDQPHGDRHAGRGWQELPVINASGLPAAGVQPVPGAERQEADLSPHASSQAAEKVLKDAGYKKVGKYLALNGKAGEARRSPIRPPTATTPPTTRSSPRTCRGAGIDAIFVGSGGQPVECRHGDWQLPAEHALVADQPPPVPAVQRLAQSAAGDQDQSRRQLRGSEEPEGRRDAGEARIDSPRVRA